MHKKTTLKDLGITRAQTIDPAEHPDEIFELWSIPACDIGFPELVLGNEVGSRKQLVKPGDVLLSRINPRINRVWTVKPNQQNLRQIASTEWVVFRSESFNSNYLRVRLQEPQFRRQLCEDVSGIGGSLTRARKSTLQNIKINVLNDLTHQRQVAAKLDLLFSHTKRANDYLSTIPTLTERFRQSVLARAFTGELTADWRKNNPDVEPASELLARIKVERRQKWIDTYARNLADRARKSAEKKGKPFSDADWQAYYDKKLKAGEKKYEEPQPVDTKKEGLPEIPESWEWVRSYIICEILTKGTTPAAQHLHKNNGDIPYIKVYNLTSSGSLNFTIDPTFVDSDIHRESLARSIVYPTDILMNIVGPPLGQAVVVPETYPEWNVNQAIAIFRLIPGVSPDFLLHYLLYNWVTSWFIRRAKTTSGHVNLTLEMCRTLPFPLPPLEEQREIIRRISDLLGLLKTFNTQTDNAIQQLDRLKSSTLSAMLIGDA